ncbi:MAG: nicotinic acid mononucleotide adenylyltransferase, partial [Bacteroidota bacterium]|nr:nicotinic acid mononucleotide adenylyltransferase [Bacteroidota bacterium]
MNKKIRTGFFGGSFNPVHKGQLGLADFILEHGYVDEVWFVVSPKNPLKATADPIEAQQR